jgi:hypothetical protein
MTAYGRMLNATNNWKFDSPWHKKISTLKESNYFTFSVSFATRIRLVQVSCACPYHNSTLLLRQFISNQREGVVHILIGREHWRFTQAIIESSIDNIITLFSLLTVSHSNQFLSKSKMNIPDPSLLKLCSLPGNRARSKQFYYVGHKLHNSIIKGQTQDPTKIIALVCEVGSCEYELTLYTCVRDVSNIKVTLYNCLLILINFILQGFAIYVESCTHNHAPIKDLFILAQIRAVLKPLVETETSIAVEDLVKNYCLEQGYVFYFSLL